MVYDASALLAVAFGEARGARVRELLDGDGAPVVSAINLGEVLVVVERRTGAQPAEGAWPKIEPVTEALIRVAAGLYLPARVARPKVSLADCVALATAMKLGTKVVTTDDDYRAFDPRWVELVG